MKAIILAAGYATRLYPLTINTAKPLLKIHGRPIIDYILDSVSHVGDIDKTIIITNNKFYQQFENWLDEKPKSFTQRIVLINDGSNCVEDRFGAIGDIQLALNTIGYDDDVLIIAGDNFFDFDLNNFVRIVQEREFFPTIAVYLPNNHPDLRRFGIVLLNETGQIVSFEEKPEKPRSNLIATCIYFMPKEKLFLISKYLESGNHKDTPGSFIQWLVGKDKVYACICEGVWFDLGDFESLSEVLLYLNNRYALKTDP
ncbi:MAG: nucleotidyltransferase family protein [Candidatus Omnitrophica bacterium]|nr:nucleotidyltransferase family protein [Candidatus Omnitrophota bacterium]